MHRRKLAILFNFLLVFPVVSLGFSFPRPDQVSGSSSSVPSWAKRAVWYQIFPERFRNGDTADDPRVEDIRGSWPHQEPTAWHLSRWTGDWYKLQTWEALDSNGFYYHSQQRRYGGDLQGIIDKLDYLSRLGVNALYITPLFASPSLHKYDASTYHHIDNNFGPDPAGDKALWEMENPADPATWKWTSADKLFLKLLHEAHKRHLRVIIDGVFNHVGVTFWAFEDLRKNQQQSKFGDWFTVKAWDDPSTPRDEFDYESWYGVKDLPELRKDSVKGMADGPREYIHAIVKRWMDPNGDGDPSDGIDGWRLDAADRVPLSFWRQFRTWTRGINPDAYLTGEIWWEDWGNDKIFNAAPWLQGDAFDAVMNYRWAQEACRFFVDHHNKITASEFDHRLDAIRSDYLTDVNFVLMNLLDSHDTDRLSSRIVNPDLVYDHNVGAKDNPNYDVRKPNKAEIRIQKLMVLFQMTSLGAPMIYYGDEVGMWGGDDPDERKPMLWPDLKFDPEESHPFGKPRPRDSNEINKDLLQYYTKLIHIRTRHEGLMIGNSTPILTDDSMDIYAFRRAAPHDVLTIVINNSAQERIVKLEQVSAARLVDLMTNRSYPVKNYRAEVSLAPKTGMILLHASR